MNIILLCFFRQNKRLSEIHGFVSFFYTFELNALKCRFHIFKGHIFMKYTINIAGFKK